MHRPTRDPATAARRPTGEGMSERWAVTDVLSLAALAAVQCGLRAVSDSPVEWLHVTRQWHAGRAYVQHYALRADGALSSGTLTPDGRWSL